MKTKKARIIACLLTIALTIGMFPYTPASAVKKVSLSSSKLNIPVGKTKKLTVKNATKTVKWKILSGKKYISTKKSGKNSFIIKGEKKGTAKIRATVGKKKLTCTVTVKKATPTPEVIVQPNESAVPTGQSEITAIPTERPTEQPTATPTQNPTEQPTATPTQRPEVKICDYNFDDGQLGDVYGNDAKLEIVEGLNSTYNGASGTDGACVKVTDRKGGWWETEAFAYKIDKLEVGKKYVISFDARHENGVSEKYDSDNRVMIVHYMPGYAQIGMGTWVFNEEWEHVEWEFTLPADYADKTGDKFIYLEFAYPEKIASQGDAYTDKNEEEYYIDNFCIKEYVEPIVLPTPTPAAVLPTPAAKPSPTPLPKGYVYKQKYEVTRWYEKGTNNGHAYSGYKYDNYAIWMVGFVDNEFSTTEDAYCSYPIDLSRVNNAEFADKRNPHDFRGEELRVKGEFSYDGTDQSTILFQIEYTQPADYPILWRWEKGASKLENAGDAKLNKVKSNITDKGYGKYGAEELKHGETGKLDINFTIPKDAENNDGLYGSICLYFPNKPDGALVYRSDNTFHFKNFSITY